MKLQGNWLKSNLSEAANSFNARPQWMSVGYHAAVQKSAQETKQNSTPPPAGDNTQTTPKKK
ncbi:hypothetical protein BGE01nite_45330 [Brevifollis gellanilyticus]|uniref:Uncharacterized protein n=1 Tax=Brevifollis gellanilyticus TaxID=748831 RepID=A0A512MEV4_9BACT|nr:hypothetical protein BGE01nite_45330 [Brevifollis gellanilyticus]